MDSARLKLPYGQHRGFDLKPKIDQTADERDAMEPAK